MVAIVGDYLNYVNEVNHDRELVLTEGISARFRTESIFEKALVPISVANHRRIIRDNINRYGKIKK